MTRPQSRCNKSDVITYCVGEVSSYCLFKIEHYICPTEVTSRGREIIIDGKFSLLTFG